MAKLRFLSDRARRHWAMHEGSRKDLCLVLSGRWPQGAYMTQEACQAYQGNLGLLGGDAEMPVSVTQVDPGAAAFLTDEILDSSDIFDLLGRQGGRGDL